MAKVEQLNDEELNFVTGGLTSPVDHVAWDWKTAQFVEYDKDGNPIDPVVAY